MTRVCIPPMATASTRALPGPFGTGSAAQPKTAAGGSPPITCCASPGNPTRRPGCVPGWRLPYGWVGAWAPASPVSAPAGCHAHSHAPLQQGGRGAGRSRLLLHRQGLPLCCLCFSRAAAALPVSQCRIRQRPAAVHPAAISQAVLQARRGAVFPDCRTLPAHAVESLRFWKEQASFIIL